ncbi:hypothetical protein BX600DRAFT_17346 [Xylariales sp. PMI_506]|nr:hypothetical protein BX600DRAFT_17346 [Xylariales sp. PMI_506]
MEIVVVKAGAASGWKSSTAHARTSWPREGDHWTCALQNRTLKPRSYPPEESANIVSLPAAATCRLAGGKQPLSLHRRGCRSYVVASRAADGPRQCRRQRKESSPCGLPRHSASADSIEPQLRTGWSIGPQTHAGIHVAGGAKLFAREPLVNLAMSSFILGLTMRCKTPTTLTIDPRISNWTCYQ